MLGSTWTIFVAVGVPFQFELPDLLLAFLYLNTKKQGYLKQNEIKITILQSLISPT